MKTKMILPAFCMLVLVCMSACSGKIETAKDNRENGTSDDAGIGENTMIMQIGDAKVNVDWEDNRAVEALKDMAERGDVTIQMSMYGDFEQVGSIGKSLPRDDKKATTSSGDIVLYSGNQMVVFYGSNTWSYTKLGRISDKDDADMADLLSNGDVTITISLEQ